MGGLRLRPIPFSLYQTQQPTHQRSAYQLHIYPPYIGMEGYIVVIVCCFSLSGYRYLEDSGTDRREILDDDTLHIGPGQISPFGGGAPRGSPNPKMWA